MPHLNATLQFAELSRGLALCDALADRIAHERARRAARLADQGLTLPQVAEALGLSTQSHAEQLVERGRAG